MAEIVEITSKVTRNFKLGYKLGYEDGIAHKGNLHPTWDEEDDYQRGYHRGWCMGDYQRQEKLAAEFIKKTVRRCLNA
jgi:hypothetical protein